MTLQFYDKQAKPETGDHSHLAPGHGLLHLPYYFTKSTKVVT